LKPQLLSGARGVVKINNTTVLAYCTDISIDVSHRVQPVHTFGSINARSVEPIQSGPCTVSIGRVIPVNDSVGNAVNSSAIATGIEPVLNQMLGAEDITVDLIDKVTNVVYASIKNCRFTGRSLSLGTSGLANERLTLMGIYDSASGNSTDGTLGL